MQDEGNEATVIVGRRAESAAAAYLERMNYQIVERNWRQRDCEIDIVARKRGAIFMVEVKYRGSDGAGSGIDYITPDKLKRMAYAARRWVHAHDWSGEYALAAIEVSGPDYEVTQFVDDIY